MIKNHILCLSTFYCVLASKHTAYKLKKATCRLYYASICNKMNICSSYSEYQIFFEYISSYLNDI